jgi:hypothetical protein
LEIPPEDENVHADAARIYCGEEPNKFGSFWYPCVSTLNAEKKRSRCIPSIARISSRQAPDCMNEEHGRGLSPDRQRG